MTIDVWLSSSLTMRSPRLVIVGMIVAFVLNPMLRTTASSFPTNRATISSTWRWRPVVPYSSRLDPTLEGRDSRLDRTPSRQVTSQSSAKPR